MTSFSLSLPRLLRFVLLGPVLAAFAGCGGSTSITPTLPPEPPPVPTFSFIDPATSALLESGLTFRPLRVAQGVPFQTAPLPLAEGGNEVDEEGSAPVSFRYSVSGNLPDTLRFDSQTRALVGTVHLPPDSQAVTYTLRYQADRSDGVSSWISVPLVVDPDSTQATSFWFVDSRTAAPYGPSAVHHLVPALVDRPYESHPLPHARSSSSPPGFDFLPCPLASLRSVLRSADQAHIWYCHPTSWVFLSLSPCLHPGCFA